VPGAQGAQGARGERAQLDRVLVFSSGTVESRIKLYPWGKRMLSPTDVAGWVVGRLAGNKQYRHGVKKRTGI
jgi:hypothetical protein